MHAMNSDSIRTKVLIAKHSTKFRRGMCTAQRLAIGTVTIAIIMIVVVSTIATGYVLLTSGASPTVSGNDWRVVSRNVTVYGKPAIIGICQAPGSTCPIGIEPNKASLNVELINYKGNYYYIHNGTIISGGIVTMSRTNSTGGLSVTTITYSQSTITYTAWFTNSTLYCVTPDLHTAPITCPP